MKTVIVTGAGKGLGLDIVKVCLAEGYHVCAISRTFTDDIAALQKSHEETFEFIEYDLQNTDGISVLCKDIIKKSVQNGLPTIYGLVNNAAVGADGVLGTMHETEIQKAIDVNLTAPILMTKYLSRAMLLNADKGRIINVGSIIGSTGYSGLSVYGATKSALEGFTRSLAREIGRKGLTANVVAPGYMRTNMTQGLEESGKLESIKRRSALRDFAPTEDVAQMVAYLLGPHAASITGTIFTVDAGSTA